MFKNPIYKCKLYSITSDIDVDPTKSMRDNIEVAPATPVATIMVKPSVSPRYFREVITGKFIPIYKETTFTNTLLQGDAERMVPRSPVYCKVNRVEGHAGEELYCDLEEASIGELEEYYIDHGDKGFYELTLYELFVRGYRTYDTALEKKKAKPNRVLSLFRRKK